MINPFLAAKFPPLILLSAGLYFLSSNPKIKKKKYITQQLSNRVFKMREENLTHKEIADALDLHSRTVGKILSGGYRITRDEMGRWLKPIGWKPHGKGRPPTYPRKYSKEDLRFGQCIECLKDLNITMFRAMEKARAKLVKNENTYDKIKDLIYEMLKEKE